MTDTHHPDFHVGDRAKRPHEYKLRDKVLFRGVLTRVVGPSDSRTWEKLPVWHETDREGVITGIRTLSDGIRHYGYDEPSSFTATRKFTAYVITFDLRRRPVYVLPEDVKPFEPAEEPSPPTAGTRQHLSKEHTS